jgi:hypothetical protein
MKPYDSPFWKGLMRVKELFFSKGSFTVGNGEDVRFREDTWLGNKSLADQYTSLYNIVQRKQVSVASVLKHNPLTISFHRTLHGNRWTLWLQLLNRLLQVQLNNEKDIFVWGLTSSGIFTVKSMYLDLLDDTQNI